MGKDVKVLKETSGLKPGLAIVQVRVVSRNLLNLFLY